MCNSCKFVVLTEMARCMGLNKSVVNDVCKSQHNNNSCLTTIIE